MKDVFVGGYALTLTSTTIDTVTVGTRRAELVDSGYRRTVRTAPTIDLVVGSARGVVDPGERRRGRGGPVGWSLEGSYPVYKFTVPADDSVFAVARTLRGS